MISVHVGGPQRLRRREDAPVRVREPALRAGDRFDLIGHRRELVAAARPRVSQPVTVEILRRAHGLRRCADAARNGPLPQHLPPAFRQCGLLRLGATADEHERRPPVFPIVPPPPTACNDSWEGLVLEGPESPRTPSPWNFQACSRRASSFLLSLFFSANRHPW